ncbi:uncharacterized protein [Linepithema humile]|uniref:uncharacterized protein isoform X2 n=1 Tax=Linepithema humile TaxID=83485 RepID=UPI00351DAC66
MGRSDSCQHRLKEVKVNLTAAQFDDTSCELPFSDFAHITTQEHPPHCPPIWRDTAATALAERISQLLPAFLRPEAAFSANSLVALTRYHCYRCC